MGRARWSMTAGCSVAGPGRRAGRAELVPILRKRTPIGALSGISTSPPSRPSATTTSRACWGRRYRPSPAKIAAAIDNARRARPRGDAWQPGALPVVVRRRPGADQCAAWPPIRGDERGGDGHEQGATRAGCRFVGATTLYAFMQAAGFRQRSCGRLLPPGGAGRADGGTPLPMSKGPHGPLDVRCCRDLPGPSTHGLAGHGVSQLISSTGTRVNAPSL